VYNAQIVDLSRFAGPPVSNERIDRGDVLEVSIAAALGADAITRFPVRVGETGDAFLPEIGSLPLAGLELLGGEQMIAAACVHRGLYRQPQVTVTMRQKAINRLTVVGAVRDPGVYELPRQASYLMSALVAAGGLADDAGTGVEIRRPALAGHGDRATLASYQSGSSETAGIQSADDAKYAAEGHVQVVRLDLANETHLGPTGNYLGDGTVIRVERRHPEPVQVIGLVRKAGQYDYPVNHELRVLGAIAMAGGLTHQVADKVYVIRKTEEAGNPTVLIEVSLHRAKRHIGENLRLAPGDIVSIEHTPITIVMEAIRFIHFSVGSSVRLF
jgi:polysaccharide export outer membrane protein